jgi:hypothetical protein
MWKEKEPPTMSITIDLQPEVERGLLAQAQAKGVSLTDYAQEILAREAHVSRNASDRTGQALIDVCAEVRGVLTDDEIDAMFGRNRSMSRPVDLS